MAKCVVPGNPDWENDHPAWVVVVVIILVQTGHVTADQGLEMLALLAALFHTDHEH